MGPISKLKQFLAGEGLRRQTVVGGAWLAIGSITGQAFRLARNIALARILSPESFGAMAIILSVSTVMDTFTEIGVREAIIQSPNGGKREYLNVAWWISAVRALASYGLIFFCAPEVARFYHNPELAALGRVALLSIVLRGVMSPAAFVSLKVMDLRRWAFLQYGSGIAGSILTVILATLMRSVWALAIGFAAEYVILCLMSFVSFPFCPGLRLARESLRELLQFSRGVLGLSFLNLIYVRADIFVLGKLIPADQLGIYSIVISSVQAGSTFLLNYQGQILMPLFSRLQQDFVRTSALLSEVTALTVALFGPVLIFICLSGRSLLALAYGNIYAAAFWPLVLATATMFLNVLNAQLTTVFYAAGRPQLHRACVFAMALLMALAIYPASRYAGTAGAQLAALIVMAAGYVIQLLQLRRMRQLQFSVDRTTLALQLAAPLLILSLAAALRHAFQMQGATVNLALGLIASLLGAGVGIFALRHRAPNPLQVVHQN